jgi:hypothetical protein
LDTTIRLWDAATGAEIAQFISFSGADTQLTAASRGLTVETETAASSIAGEWLSITPDGYYQASPRGDRYLNVRVNNTVSGIDAYRSVLYNPDVVQARLRGLPDPASKSTLTIQQAAAMLPPTVILQTSDSITTTSAVTLSVSVTDQNLPLRNIKIIVNGRLLGQSELRTLTGTTGLQPERASLTATGNQKAVNFQIPLILDPDLNVIEVVAFNGYSESRKTTQVTWRTSGGQKPALPNLWILAVGVNHYDNAGTANMANMASLNYCGNDARELVDAFKSQEGKRYAKVNALLITDDSPIAPTTENIRKNLSFLDQAGPRDVVLLFMAGHGITDKTGGFFFLAKDAVVTQNAGAITVSRGVPNDDIIAVLEAPGNRLVFIDACQSGSVDNNRLIRSLMDSNAFVFAASQGNESSLEFPLLRHGAFTYSVVQQLLARSSAQGGIGMLQLSGNVSNDVVRITQDRQHPKPYYQGYHDFFIAE